MKSQEEKLIRQRTYWEKQRRIAKPYVSREQAIFEGSREAALGEPAMFIRNRYVHIIGERMGYPQEIRRVEFYKHGYMHEQFFIARVTIYQNLLEGLYYIYVYYRDDSAVRLELPHDMNWYEACQYIHKKDVLDIEELVFEGFQFE